MVVSSFSEVDAAADPGRLVASLAASAEGLASMKAYMAAAHAAHGVGGPVLNVGCGSGHDLAALARIGVAGVGVDPSDVMVRSCRWLTEAPVLRADGASLSFRTGSFSGCWIERVLQHVESPAAVLAEAVRCVVAGGLVTVFEPDWTSMTVTEGDPSLVDGWRPPARHPAIGSEVGALLSSLGCDLRDRVEERSWWSRGTFERTTKRSVPADAAFRAEMVKVLWVATAPA
jgi:SAM-dependent methyltransferase